MDITLPEGFGNVSFANNSLQINFPAASTNVEGDIVLTLEVALAILSVLTPLGVILPAWLIIVLPILRADIPVAQALFDTFAKAIQEANSKGISPADTLKQLNSTIQQNWEHFIDPGGEYNG